MNMLFKSSKEAIDACNADNDRAWQEYLVTNHIDPSKAPEAAAAAQAVFRAGYMAGAKWVSGAIIEKMMAHGKKHIIQPDQPTQ
jgi:hypothetical protein